MEWEFQRRDFNERWFQSCVLVSTNRLGSLVEIRSLDFFVIKILNFQHEIIRDNKKVTSPKSRNLANATQLFNQTYQRCLLGIGGRSQRF